MKKFILFFLTICVTSGYQSIAQGGLLKKVSRSMTNELLAKPEETSSTKNSEPEPSCACEQPELIFDLGGKVQLMYSELTFSVNDDGSLLVKSRVGDEYYIVKDGSAQGPLKEGDPRIADFTPGTGGDNGVDNFILNNKPYISRAGDKLLITFGGKTYGPYGSINNFVVSRSKEKFAAIVVENVLVTEDDGKKMEAASKNAKTDQEKMDIAMQYAQQMQQRMMQGGGPESVQPKFVSNIPNVNYDPVKVVGSNLNGKVKYDDVVMVAYDKILDLNGNKLLSIKPEAFNAEYLFVNTDNTKYAYYNYGTLTFSDNTTMSDLFAPHLVKTGGKIYLAYMYYSPKRNSFLQCKIPF